MEPGDYEAVTKIFSGPKAVWGTLQTPYPSAEMWRKRLAEPPKGFTHSSLVSTAKSSASSACILHRADRASTRHFTGHGRRDWVIPTGGGYFFAPSIDALRDVLAK